MMVLFTFEVQSIRSTAQNKIQSIAGQQMHVNVGTSTDVYNKNVHAFNAQQFWSVVKKCIIDHLTASSLSKQCL